MSKALNTKISFKASDSPDVVGYKLYIEPAPSPVTYDSKAFDLGNKTEVLMSTLPEMDQVDGVYNVGVTSVDDAGNESDMTLMENVSLDFLAPAAPTDLQVTRV